MNRSLRLLVLISLYLSSCKSLLPTDIADTVTFGMYTNQAYPTPISIVTPIDPYPPPQESYREQKVDNSSDNNIFAYPPPEEIIQVEHFNENINIIPFQLEKPVFEGSLEVNGKGPANVFITISDLTFSGEILGDGKINSDGIFNIQLLRPTEKNHRIGISIDNTYSEQYSEVDFNNTGFFGDESRLVPFIGFFYDTAMVISK